MGNILSSFRIPIRASKASTSWEDLTSFDVSFLYKNIDNLPQVIEVIVDRLMYEVKLKIKYCNPYISLVDPNSSQDYDQVAMDEDREEFWFGLVRHGNKNSFLRPQPPAC